MTGSQTMYVFVLVLLPLQLIGRVGYRILARVRIFAEHI